MLKPSNPTCPDNRDDEISTHTQLRNQFHVWKENIMKRDSLRLIVLLGVLIISFAGCSKSVDPKPPVATEYYVYATGNRPIPGDNHTMLFKIDATADSVVDSLRLTYPCLELECSPDGRYLWSAYSGPDNSSVTVVYNASNLSVAHIFEGLGLFEPVWDPNFNYVVVKGRGICYLDKQTFEIVSIDSSVSLLMSRQLWRIAHLPERKCLLGNFVRRGDSVDYSNDNRMHYYNYETRTLVDSIDLYDIDGNPAPPYGELSPNHDQLFGWKMAGPYGDSFFSIVFSLTTGRALGQWWSSSVGNVIFVDDGRKFVRTAPGNMQLAPPGEVLPLYDATTLQLIDTLSLRGQGWEGRDLAAIGGVWVSGQKKIYVATGGWTGAGGVAVVTLQPYAIKKLLLSGDIYVSIITIGRK
jgi:hypothetical protein